MKLPILFLCLTGSLFAVIPKPFATSDALDNPEGYRLEIDSQGKVNIQAKTDAGRFYAKQTLLQLQLENKDGKLPEMVISDAPRFAWRGLMLDVSRHIFSVDEIKKLLDVMAVFKLNRLHFHLTDGPGWRVEIKKYPRLTDYAAWRVDKTDKVWNWRDTEMFEPGEKRPRYGGFYSQSDIRGLVRYAAERHILIVPEIEMPGHSFAAMMAYPELACPTTNIAIDGLRGKDVVCVSNPKTLEFFKNVLDEIFPLFPGSPIHIGCDEVPVFAWQACPTCDGNAYRKFVHEIISYVHFKNRAAIAWDDLLDHAKDRENFTPLFWRKNADFKGAILAPAEFCYFDYYQENPKTEPPAIGGFIPLEKVYSFSPSDSVAGIQANLWTEFIPNVKHLQYMLFPRLLALAEVAWTNHKDYNDFQKRLPAAKELLKSRGINFRE